MTATWRAFLLDEGAYAGQPAVSVVRDDDHQERVLSTEVSGDVDDALARNGWRRTGDWSPGVDGRHAPVARAGPGRISRGARVETKLPDDVLARVVGLVGTQLGSDRSEVIAALVQRGLRDV